MDEAELRQDIARGLAARPAYSTEALLRTSLRTKSIYAREILAECAWPGHPAEELYRWADDRRILGVRPGMDPQGLAMFARVLALQIGDGTDVRRARVMLERAAATSALAEHEPAAVELLLQLRINDRDSRARDLLGHPGIDARSQLAARADLANPFLFREQTMGEWTARFNEVLGNHGLVELSLLQASFDGLPFDRLHAPDVPAVVGDQPLITVITSCFRPDQKLLTAARSVVAQSWGNWELLIIDDASSREYDHWLVAATQLDPRIRVVRKAVNGGTYRARNTALRQARGEFCTFLDSDDYFHPQALERSVAPMTEHAGPLAVSSRGPRVTSCLEFNRPGYAPIDGVATSLMFRRSEVLNRIGFFDTTRKGADTEFAKRIETAFDTKILTLNMALTIVRAGETLSSAEFSKGWRHPSRRAYRGAYLPWHRAIRNGQASPFLDPTEPRRFPEPHRWQRDPLSSDGSAVKPQFEVCFGGDWRAHGGPQRSMLEEIRAAREVGMRVGIMHLEAFRFMTSQDQELCAPIMDLINNGTVSWIQIDDNVKVETLIIRYPPVLQNPPHVRSPLSVGSLLIVANQAPVEPDGTDRRYASGDVTARAGELFGRSPIWVPQGPTVRRALLHEDSNLQMTPWDNPGLIDVGEWSEHRSERRVGRLPIQIGRYSRDNRIKFPGTFAELLKGYSFGDEYEVQMMGATRAVTELADRAGKGETSDIPRNWKLFNQGAMPPQRFLSGLDFFLYLDNPDTYEAFGRVLLEAAASGVLTIAHPKHEETFGELFDYALPGEAQGLIATYAHDDGAYRHRVERTISLVEERYSRQSFIQRLREFQRAEQGPVADPAPAEVDRPFPGGEALCELSVSRNYGRGAPLRFHVVAPWESCTLMLRSASDAERADQVTVIFAAESGATIERWLMAQAGDLDLEVADQALLDSIPGPVAAVILCRDGFAWACSRFSTEGFPDGSSPVWPTPLKAPHGWQTHAWWF